uniref:Uncharacterized protein n=1 Tax=Peronospora matthiolae TaxID=2874970 RepID=A0AAV1T8V1_9STRA
MAQNRQPSENIHELHSSAIHFVEFVQSKYDRMRVRYDEEVQRSDAFREALVDRVDQVATIAHLKAGVLRTVRARHAAQAKADREIVGIRKQMDDAGNRLVTECDRLSDSLRKAKNRKSQYKVSCIHIQSKLSRALKQVAGLQVKLAKRGGALYLSDQMNVISCSAPYKIT